MAFHREDLDRMIDTDLTDKFLEAFLEAGDIKDLPSVARAKYKVVVYEGHGRSCTSI